MKLQGQHIYGSARLGVVKPDLEMIGAVDPSDVGEFDRVRGMKRYELSNHLGNVLTVISDRKIATVDNGVNIYYHAEIISYSDYYPFGAPMSQSTTDRTWSVEEYRFGFNGKEQIDEMIGESNGYDFGARMYDARLGRWWSVDKMYSKHPDQSVYKAMMNNPLVFIDPDGETEFYSLDDKGNKVHIKTVKDGSTAVFVLRGSLLNWVIPPNKYAQKCYVLDGYSLNYSANGIELPVPPLEVALGTNSRAEKVYNAEVEIVLRKAAKVNIATVVEQQFKYTENVTKPLSNGTTYCNTNFFASICALTGVKLDDIAQPGKQMANNIFSDIDQYKANGVDLFSPCTWEEALAHAEKGGLAVASSEADRHGHITLLKSNQSKVASKEDLVFQNVGLANGELKMKDIWESQKSRDAVKFYKFNDKAVKN